MQTDKMIFRISLSVFALAMVGAVVNSIVNYESVVATFQALGYPVYLIHLLGMAQITGVVMLVFNKDEWNVEWVYAGFFMNFSMGFIAHLVSNSGNGGSAVVCLLILWVTYVQSRKLRASNKNPNTVADSLPLETF